ncbi:MAG: hypothetical protein RLZZ175_3102 [Bacteroidota bacterium]|jgi:hypothetical protein
MNIEYLNCLKSQLPCEGEKSKEYFLISLDSTNKFVLMYDGSANNDYNRYDFNLVTKTNFEIYSKQYSQSLMDDTITIIGQIKIKNDTLFFIESSGKLSKFIYYSSGDNDSYFKEHIKLLNFELKVRGYDKLDEILHSDSLKCWCNWELDGGLNIIFSPKKDWILEKKENELFIYEWTNPPHEKTIDLKIKKKLVRKFKW